MRLIVSFQRGVSLSLPIALGAEGWMSCLADRSLALGSRHRLASVKS